MIQPGLSAVTHHVLECGPADGPIVEVLLKEEDAGSEVAVVVLVRDAPAKGAKLAPLLHDAVQEAEAEQQLPPLRCLHALQPLLQQ